jgi:Flp pilus assembly protein TadD
MSDPIDFLMQESVEEPPPPQESTGNSSTDRINTEDKKEEEMDTLIGEAGAGSSLEMHQYEKSQSQQVVGTMEQKSEEKEVPPPLNLGPQDDFNKGENIIATTKIEIDEKNKAETQELDPGSATSKIQSPKSPPDPTNLDMAKIKRSNRIAYLSGNNIAFTGGPKISEGDEIQVGENTYEVRTRPKDMKNLYGLIGSIVLAIFITLYFLGAFNSSPYGNLVGMVVGPDDRPLANQEVRIKEKGTEIKTNNAGFFVFNNLPVGIYTVEYLVDDEVVGEERITVLSNKTSTMRLSESEPEPIGSIKSTPATAKTSRASRETEKKTVSSNVASRSDETEPGILKLTLKPHGVRSYLDGKPMGVGSNAYRVRPGKYILSVKKRGYQSQSKKITVKSGKSLSYSFSLEKEAGSAPKTDSEIARENEVAGRYSEAQKYYDKILNKNPEDLSALLGKARCLKNQGMEESAMTYFVKAGKIATERGNTDAQYDALSGIIEMNPNSFTTYFSRADLLYSTGDYSRAAEDYQKVITLDHRNLKAHYKLGNSYYKGGKYNNALEAFKAAEELHFADPKAQYYLALTYHALDDKRNTKKSYEKFKELASYSTAIEFKKDPEWKKVLEYLEVEN